MSEGLINQESIAANFWMENRMSGHRHWLEREDCESDVAKFLNRIKAEAWDEGFEAGNGLEFNINTPNPYRDK